MTDSTAKRYRRRPPVARLAARTLAAVALAGIAGLAHAQTPLTGAVKVSAGYKHSCAVLGDGTVDCWGNDQVRAQTSTAVPVSGVSGIAASAAGDFTCALATSGAVKCWGYNSAGELGDGTTNNSTAPVAVSGITTAKSIAAGAYHTCATLADKTVRCWGSNGSGRLGDGTTTNSPLPVAVNGINNARSVAVGYDHSCAVLNDDTLRCWGSNAHGQLGASTPSTTNSTPVTVPLGGVATVAAGRGFGEYHTCALLNSGQVSCWGENLFGELGNGGAGGTTPTLVAGISGASAIAAGRAHTCALISGAVKCWGSNNSGQLGDGSAPHSPQATPVAVSGISTAVAIAAGGDHTCAVLGDGTAQCWGANDEGQLGRPKNAPPGSSTPLPVLTGPEPVQTTSNSTSQVLVNTGNVHAILVGTNLPSYGAGTILVGDRGTCSLPTGAFPPSGCTPTSGSGTAADPYHYNFCNLQAQSLYAGLSACTASGTSQALALAETNYNTVTFTISPAAAAVAPPVIAANFNPISISPGATSTLGVTITNPASNTVALTGVGLANSLPAGLTVANSNAPMCGGTLVSTAPNGIGLTAATIPVNGQCQFSLVVTGATPGSYTASLGSVASVEASGNGNTANAALTVTTLQLPQTNIQLQAMPDPATAGQPVQMQVVVSSQAMASMPPASFMASTGTPAATPAGIVTIAEGGNACTATLDGAGQGGCPLVFATPGTHSVTATYLGDATHRGSSQTLRLIVLAAGPALTAAPAPLSPWLFCALCLGVIALAAARRRPDA